MSIEQRIKAFNRANPPFYLVEHDDGTFSLLECARDGTLECGYVPDGRNEVGTLSLIQLEEEPPRLLMAANEPPEKIVNLLERTAQLAEEQGRSMADLLTNRDFSHMWLYHSFDFITSVAAFGNIPESDKVAKELYRILKENGKLIIQGLYIEKGSQSFEVAKNLGLEKGLVEEYLVDELRKAGFREIVSTIVDEAVWAENPYDRIPVTGDIQKFCIIQAKK